MRAPSAPIFYACEVKEIASSVEFEPVPANTGNFPLLSLTQSSIILSCSKWLKVGDSPVVPAGTKPFVPFLIWKWINLI